MRWPLGPPDEKQVLREEEQVVLSEEMQALSISGDAEAIFWLVGISWGALWTELQSVG